MRSVVDRNVVMRRIAVCRVRCNVVILICLFVGFVVTDITIICSLTPLLQGLGNDR